MAMRTRDERRAKHAAVVAHRFAMLLLGHALADGPLQPAIVSRAKRGVPHGPSRSDAIVLHAACHRLAAAIATRRPFIGIAEAVIHAATDELKCRGKIGTVEDQAIHVGCKLLWALLSAREPPA